MAIRYYTDKEQIEERALEALSRFENAPGIEEIAVFPDIHFCAERAIPVGVAFKTQDVFYPLVTGKDMGCGVAFMTIPKIYMRKPFDKSKRYRAFEKASNSMTDEGLGGGNHFHSLEEDDENLYVIVHTGSRNLGIYMYQQNYSLIRESGDTASEYLPIEVATPEYVKEYNRILKYASDRRMQFLRGTQDFLTRNGYLDNYSFDKFGMVDSVHNLLEFTEDGVIHRKGSTQLDGKQPAAIPLSMTRGSLIVKANPWTPETDEALWSCSHGAGRLKSRTDTLKHWHSLKKAEKEEYKQNFSEMLNRSGEFDSSLIQEFDFAYKDSSTILETQPYLIRLAETSPIVTVKFTAV